MAITYRVVDIIVPNRNSKKAKANLAIIPIDPAKLEGVAFEAAALKVRSYGLTTSMCGDLKTTTVQQHLTITLEPFQEVTVRAIIETTNPRKGKAIAAFVVTETRSRKVTGGVTIVCTSPQYPADLPSAPDPANPCPIILAAGLTAVDPGVDPRSSTTPGVINTKHPQDLVALVENPARKTLTNAVMWLEHMDRSGVISTPRVWHLGTIEPKGQFWATWEVDGRGASSGQWEASFIVSSDNFDPIRLRAGFSVLPRNW